MVVELNADTRLATIPDKESGRAIGKIAAADLPAGAVVSPDQFTDTAPIKDGEAIVGVMLEPGEVPTATMRPGDIVQVVQAAKAQQSPAGGGQVSAQTRVLVRAAEVVDVVDRQGRAFVSLRMGQDADGSLLIVLGPSFPNGNDGDVAARFSRLERWVRDNVPAGEVAWRWVNEDYDTADDIPYAGALSGKAAGMYVASGFNGWGISNGTAAAMLIADQIQGQRNPWRTLYDPRRRAPKDFNPGGDTKSRVASLDDIAAGAGGIIEQGKRQIAVFKDSQGKARAFSAACTHKGCTVTWNNADRTWDCPCHGSVFSCDGQVMHGPATEPLEPARLANDRN